MYYDAPEAKSILTVERFKVGSIVEGSDVEIGPYYTDEENTLSGVVERVRAEASEAWEEAHAE